MKDNLGALLAPLLILISVILLAPPSAQAYTSPNIWVGSPVAGTWGCCRDWGTTAGGGHHRLVKASPRNDWATDLTSGAGSAAYLYAAPSNSALNNAVTAKIIQIVDDNACANGGGGDFVTVGIYYNGTLYGRATYAHLDRDGSLYVGKPVSRWGTYLGSVAQLSGGATGGPSCWTGAHVHFELRAETNYACWNRGYTSAGYPLGRENFLGFLSGPLGGAATACP
jgi:hypothetical protein